MRYLHVPFEMPDRRFVGLLSCQCDAMMRSMRSQVLSCQAAPPPVAKTNQAKKTQRAPGPSEPVYEVVLNDTVLFPEGGGQPNDLGTLSDGANVAKVFNVVRQGLTAVHYVDRPIDTGAHVSVDVNWDRRLDHMQQHTGQHLISSVLQDQLGIPTLGWSLSPFPSPSYVELPKTPSAEEIRRLSDMCNSIIRDNPPVTVDVTLQDDSEALPSKLPNDYQGGVIRHVQIHHPLIPNDRNPCCGTHFPSISHLQAVHILPTVTSIRGTNSRLYFVVGNRVLENLRTTMEVTRLSSLELGGAETNEIVGRLQAALQTIKEGNRREKKLKAEVSSILASQLAEEAQKSPNQMAFLARQDEEIDFLQLISAKLKAILPPTNEFTFTLVSQNIAGPSPIIVTGAPQRVNVLVQAMKTEFGSRLKGGGKGGFQGKLEGKASNKDIAFLQAECAKD